MGPEEYAELDATALAALLRRREVTEEEVADAARAAIDAVDATLNAVVARLDPPLGGGEPGAPFAGVPFLVKDLVLTAEGVPTRSGSRLLEGVVGPADSDLMRRWRAAGLRTHGVTATPEFGFNATTEPVLTGPVRNPWRPDHSAGGSSGGSGAMVAARAVPVAHANDGGGSIRIPAAVNGLVGLKPTRGRVPLGPGHAEALGGMGIEFALTRTVRDCAALLDAVHGPGVGEKYVPPAVDRPFADAVGAAPGRLRVACTTTTWDGEAVDPECVAAVDEVAALLADLGHDVVADAPPVPVEAMDEVNVRQWCGFVAAGVAAIAPLVGRTPGPETLEATTLRCYEHGLSLTALDLLEAEAMQNAVTRAVAGWFAGVDVLLTPTIRHATFPLGLLDANDPSLDARAWCAKIFGHAPFTALFNMTGQPAMNVPVAWTADGRPCGTQLAARFGDEATLLRLAAQLEQARPWGARRPGVTAAAAA